MTEQTGWVDFKLNSSKSRVIACSQGAVARCSKQQRHRGIELQKARRHLCLGAILARVRLYNRAGRVLFPICSRSFAVSFQNTMSGHLQDPLEDARRPPQRSQIEPDLRFLSTRASLGPTSVSSPDPEPSSSITPRSLQSYTVSPQELTAALTGHEHAQSSPFFVNWESQSSPGPEAELAIHARAPESSPLPLLSGTSSRNYSHESAGNLRRLLSVRRCYCELMSRRRRIPLFTRLGGKRQFRLGR